MHSAILRGADFKVKYNNVENNHSKYCKWFTTETKVGVFTPKGIEAVGATNLILLLITAFYDRLRSNGIDFHSYPEFYTFQCNKNQTDYSMYDIYPEDKNISIPDDYDSLFHVICEKQINILISPEENNTINQFSKEQSEFIKNNITRRYFYSENGEVQNPNLVIETDHAEISEWSEAVVKSHENLYRLPEKSGHKLIQSFQEVKI